MKTRLLTLAALGWAASAMAGDWVKPSVANLPKVEPTDGEIVYILNEQAGQFMLGANAWGTHASIADQGIPFKLVYENLQQKKNYPDVMAWGIKNQGAAKKDKYLCHLGDAELYIDMGNQNNECADIHHWNIVKNEENGLYTIQVVEQCTRYVETEYVAWDGSETGLVVANFDPTKAGEGDTYGMYWSFVTVEAYDAYSAKLALYNKLNEAETEGVATADAEAVYNSAEATAEEINAAITALDGAIVAAKTAEAFADASPENPVDATFLIKNADFSENTSGSDQPGWDCTFDGWQKTRVDGPAGGVQIKGPFVEQWVPGGQSLSDRYCKQNVALPAGLYSVSADITALQQGDRSLELTGCNFFAIVGGEKQMVSCSSQNESGDVPVRYNIGFYVAENGTEVTIGFETVKTNANWVAFDNFKLQYMGNAGTPSFINMKVACNELKTILTDNEDIDEPWLNDNAEFRLSFETNKEMTALVAEAEAMTNENSDEECDAMLERIKAMTAQVKAEMEAYTGLSALCGKAQKFADDLVDVDVVGEALGDLYGEIVEALEEGSASLADIEEFHARYDNLITVEFPKHIEEGMDLTCLLQNPNFDGDSRDGWTAPQGWTNVAAGCAEQWNRDFDVYQVIKNLPKGLYEVGLNGFYRQGGWEAAAAKRNAGEENITAYVYGESGGVRAKTPFASIFEGMLDEGDQYTDGSDVVHNSDVKVTIDDKEGYIPDGMAGFAHHVNNHEQYYFTVQLFVLDGTLQLGAMNEKHNEADWVIFDNFTLKYVSKETGDLVRDAAQKEVDELIERREQVFAEVPLPEDIYDAVDNLQTELDNAEDDEAIGVMLEHLNEVKKQLDEVAAEAKEHTKKWEYYWNNYELLVESTDETFGDYISELGDVYCAGVTPWANVEEMREALKEMNRRWVAYVTADTPEDMSEVIANRGFFDEALGNSNLFWNITMDNTTDKGTQAANHSEQEFYQNDSFDFNQTIEGLPAGYYEMQVQGFYRPGWGLNVLKADTTYAHNAKLYATTDENHEWAADLMTIYDDAAPAKLKKADGSEWGDQVEAKKPKLDEAGMPVLNDEGAPDSISVFYPNMMEVAQQAYFTYRPETEAEDEDHPNKYGYYRGNKVQFRVEDGQAVTLGVKKNAHIVGDWCLIDDFQLFYLGTTAPEGFVDGAPTGIVTTRTSARQAYYTIGGMPLSRPQKGVNIVITTLSDGTKVTSKVLVK